MSTALPNSPAHREPTVVSKSAGSGRAPSADRPYWQATLAEHERMQIRLRRVGYAFEDEVLRFLGVADRDTVIVTATYPRYEVPQLQRALTRCFPDWTVVAEGGADGYSGHLWAPTYRPIQIRPGRRRNYLVHGTRFFELPDGSRRVALFESDPSSAAGDVEFSLLAAAGKRQALHAELRRLRREVPRNHYLRRQAIDAGGRLLGGRQRVGWNDLIVDAKLTDALRRHVLEFLKLGKLFRRNGVPHRRGLLLYGPPGNGKTTIGRVLAGTGRTTFVYVTAADLGGGPLVLRAVFELARRLRPTIVFLEDLDFYASERGAGANEPALGELLAQMDGLKKNDGLIVIATTNDIAAIEPALKDRPSRFDAVLEVPLPDENCRRLLLARFLRRAAIGEAEIAAAAAAGAGLSGAQLRELSVLVVQQAIMRGAIDAAGRAQPAREDVDFAVDQMLGRRKEGKLGFHVPS